MVLGFHGGDYEECRLLGCDIAWILLEPTFRGDPSSWWKERLAVTCFFALLLSLLVTATAVLAR
jgi:hypothetical protein